LAEIPERVLKRARHNGFTPIYLLIFLALVSGQTHAQGTIHFDFRSLPPGQVVGEQFSASGVHFLPAGFADPLMTVSAPPFFDPAGATVGYAITFLMKFDQPITSISFDIGQVRVDPLSSGGVWGVTARDTQGPRPGLSTSGLFPPETRSIAVATFPADARVDTVLFESAWVYPGELFDQSSYIDNINVTVIPEPGFLAVFMFGSALLGLWTLRRAED
jgi:hypothetical protein